MSSSTPSWMTFGSSAADANESMISEFLIQKRGISVGGLATSTANKVYVEHHYVDHYNDPIYHPHDGSSKRRGPRGGVLVPFPEKLYQMLNQISEDGLDDVVSWQPHGRCFVVHQPERFVKEVMPRYFSQTKLTSFQRQVNLYGFRRLTTGTDRNGYYHELFLRGRPDLLKKMTRVRVKGIGCKLAPSPATEPNFYKLTSCHENKMADMLLASESFSEDAKISPALMQQKPLQTPSCPPKLPALTSAAGSSSSYLEHYMSGKLELARDCGHSSLKQLRGGAAASQSSLFLQVSGWGSQLGSSNKKFKNNSLPASVPSSSASGPPPLRTNTSLFPDEAPSSAPGDAEHDDLLNPLPSSTSRSYLMDMQDDIIDLLASSDDLVPTSALFEFDTNNNSNDNSILTDMANLWEI